MLTYQQYEEAVYNWLYKKHKADAKFTFSLRQKAKNRAEKDYFIGTEQSNYFAFTLWHIPVGYPGSSGDLISIVFKVRASGVKSLIEITHTNSPEEGQNQYALELVNTSKEKVKKSSLNIIRESKPSQNNFRVNILPGKPSYKELDEMLEDLDKFFNKFIPIVNEAIEEVKRKHPDFEAHRITPEEFEEMHESMIERREKHTDSNQNSFDESEHSTYIQELKQIVNKLGLKRGDPRIVFTTRDKSYNFIVGQRYAFCLYRNNSEGNFGVISNQPIGENSKKYEGENPKAYFSLLDKSELNSDHLNEIEKAIILELERTEKSGYLKYSDVEFENMIFGEKSDEKQNTMKAPLNQILYGPPGTGKTYKLKTDYFPIYTSTETAITKEVHFENTVRDCSWWQVIAVALIQLGKSKVSDIIEHPWVVQKKDLSNSKTVRPTLWGQLQSHTVESCEFVNVKSKQQPFIFTKTEDSYWEIIDEEVKEQIPEIYELIDSVENFKPNPNKEVKRYIFTTFHQSFNYEDFIEGIKPVMDDEEGTGDVSYHIEDGIFKDICKRAEIDPNNRYAIFIDEINRGNVSAIFGELITLIESDKRLGEVNEMKVKLPYSKKYFGVPSNLDIYGTMNTADRSVEALDTALRRRFTFKEMMPKPELLSEERESGVGEVEGIVLENLLRTINDRIEVLVDRDHTIGHSYFMNVNTKQDLKNVFKDKVLPLLQEYFFGYYSKMELVIGSYFFETNLSEVAFAVENDNYFDRGKRYVLKDLDDDRFDIIRALQELSGNKVEE